MSKRWGMALMILVAGLLLASPNINAAEAENPGTTIDSPEYLDPEVQLYIEQRINEKNLEDYEKIIDIKMKAIEKVVDNRLSDYRWFAGILITLLGIFLATGGFFFIKKRVALTIDKVVKEEIKNSLDEFDKMLESYKRKTEILFQEAKEEIIKNMRPEEMTKAQKEIIEEAAEETEKKPEEEYSAEDYYWRGLKAYHNDEFEDAVKYSKRAIELAPNYVAAYINLGFSCLRADKYDQAIDAFTQTIGLVPNKEMAYFILACVYSRKKDKANALKYLELAIDKGYDNLEHIEQTPDLEFIRNTPEYQRIIKKLKAKKNL